MISAKMSDVLACCTARWMWGRDLGNDGLLERYHALKEKTFPDVAERNDFTGFTDALFDHTDLTAEAVATLCRLFIHDVEES